MKNCYELTGALNGIEVDSALVFPNVQTCVAIVAVSGGQVIGAHATFGDPLTFGKRPIGSNGGFKDIPLDSFC